MNRGIYRLIFNAAKGVIEVAGELASSQGKDKQIGASSRTRSSSLSVGFKPLTFACLVAMGQVWSPIALSQIVVDGSVAQQTQVTNTANGLPQVNINAATAGGVSRNTFTQFDVGRQGVILNNAITNTPTQQAGFVAANPNLVGGQARVILNEVNSTQRSVLNGFLEVAGQRADVIVANPAGITCSGCGFINVQRGTLTTGDPTFTNGELSGFRVNGGEITIGRDGLDASGADFTDVIARSVKVNGAIVANTLGVTTGRNQVNTDNTGVIALADDGSERPEFAIDVAALGGMFAGQIHLIGTEQGVGVRNAGDIGASAGNFVLTAEGGLVNTNSIVSTGDTNIAVEGDLRNEGTLHSGGNSQVVSAANVVNDGTLSATGNVTLTANGNITQSADAGLGAGVNENGVIDQSTDASLTVSAGGDLNIQSNQVASTNISLTATNITLTDAQQQADTITLIANDDINANGLVQTAETLSISGESVEITGGDQLADNTSVTATVGDISLTDSSLISTNNLTLTANGDIATTNSELLSTSATIAATNLRNDANSTIGQVGDSAITIEENIDNEGTLSAGAIALTARTLSNTATGEITANSADINLAVDLNNRGLLDISEAVLNAQTINNIGTGRVFGDNIALQATTINNLAAGDSAAVIAARSDLQIGVNNLNNAEESLIFSSGDLTIGGTLTNGLATGRAGQIVNDSATLEAGQNLAITATTIENLNDDIELTTETTVEENLQAFQLGTSINFVEGTVSNGILNLASGGTSDDFVTFMFTRTTTRDVISNSSPALITAAGNIQLDTSALVTNQNSQIAAGNTLSIEGDRIDNVAITGTERVSESGTFTQTIGGGGAFFGTSIDGGTTGPFPFSGPDNLVRIRRITGTRFEGGESNAGDVPFISEFAVSAAGFETLPQIINESFQGGDLQTERVLRTVQTTGNDRVDQITLTSSMAVSNQVAGAGLVIPDAIDAAATVADSVDNNLATPVQVTNLAPTLPTNSFFSQNASPTASVLIETDPQFTNGNNFLSSDFFLDILGLDTADEQKRLGDGFFEQRFVRDQLLALTGQRFLAGFGDDEAQYRALLTSGAAFAQDYNIIPGVALSAEQLALLTTDAVLLVSEEVTLADGSTQSVLVPRVYTVVRPGDINGSGSLLSGRQVALAGQDISNSGAIAGGRILTIDTNNFTDTRGHIKADSIRANARGDIRLSGSQLTATDALSLNAGDDLTLEQITQTEEGLQGGTRIRGTDATQLTVTGEVGTLALKADNDLTVLGSQVTNQGEGSTTLTAGNNLTIGATTNQETSRAFNRTEQVGSTIDSQGDISLGASNNVAIEASSVDAGQNLSVSGRNITVTAGENSVSRGIEPDSRTRHTGFNLRGTEQSHTTSSLSAGNDINLDADNTLAIKGSAANAGQDITLSAEDINISAVTNESTTNTGGVIGSKGFSTATTQTQTSSTLTAGNNVTATATDGINITGSDITAVNNIALQADDIAIASAESNSSSRSRSFSTRRESRDRVNITANLTAGNNVTLDATNNIDLTGTNVQAGENIALNAGGDTTIAVAQDEAYTYSRKKSSSSFGRSKVTIEETLRTTNVGGNLNAGNNITINAEIDNEGTVTSKESGNVRIEGSNLTAADQVAIAGDDVSIVDKTEIDYRFRQTTKTGFGGLSRIRRTRSSRDEILASSNVTAEQENLDLISSNNLTITGSNVVAGGDVNLQADGDITIEAGEQNNESFYQKEESRIGFFSNGGLNITFGSLSTNLEQTQRNTEQISSTVGSVNGDVNINADDDVDIAASDIITSEGDINVEADNINITARDNVTEFEQLFEQDSAGITLGLTGGVADAINVIDGARRSISNTDNSTLQALRAAQIGLTLNQLNNAGVGLDDVATDLSAAGEQLSNLGNAPLGSGANTEGGASGGVNISLSIGASSTREETESRTTQALGSSLASAGDINLTARGDGTEGSGDITTQGARLNANNITLDAADKINLTSAENTSESESTSESSGGSIGISLGAGGLQVFVEANQSEGLTNQTDDQFLESQLTARNNVTIRSDSDTTLEGAQVRAESINADIGGDLNIISQQDRSTFEQENSSSGGKLGVGIGVTVSLNFSELEAEANHQAVQEQSGLFAGEGGFDINVENNTHLEGGAIVGSSNPDNNRISTDTLSTENIENISEFDIDSSSIGIAVSTDASVIANVLSNAQQLAGGGGEDSGSVSNTTSSVISNGTIDIRSGDDVALADIKDTEEEAHQVLENIFDPDQVEEFQQDLQEQREINQLASETASNLVQEIVAPFLSNAEDLRKEAKNTKDPKERARLIADAERIEGQFGPNSIGSLFANSILVGAITGDLSGNLLATGSQIIGAELSREIGLAAKSGEIDTAVQLIAHAALGCGIGEANGGSCSSGAIGGVVGEIVGDALRADLEKRIAAGDITIEDLERWRDQGVDIAALAGGIAALLVNGEGSDLDVGAIAGENAAENNAFQELFRKRAFTLLGLGAVTIPLNDLGLTEEIKEELFSNTEDVAQFTPETLDFNALEHEQLAVFLDEGEILSGVIGRDILGREVEGFLLRTEDGFEFQQSLSLLDEAIVVSGFNSIISTKDFSSRLIVNQFAQGEIAEGLRPNEFFDLGDGSILIKDEDGGVFTTSFGSSALGGFDRGDFDEVDATQVLTQIPEERTATILAGTPIDITPPLTEQDFDPVVPLSITALGDPIPEQSLEDQTFENPILPESRGQSLVNDGGLEALGDQPIVLLSEGNGVSDAATINTDLIDIETGERRVIISGDTSKLPDNSTRANLGNIKASETIGKPVEAVINNRKRLLRVDIEPNGKLQIQSGGGKDSIVDFRPDLSKPLAPQINSQFKRLPKSARDQLIRNAEKGLKRLTETGNL